jgi:hypothetical protein
MKPTTKIEFIPKMPAVSAREPFDAEIPEGYQESLLDWFHRNETAVEWFLEHSDAISKMRDTLETLAVAEMGDSMYARVYEAQVKEMAYSAVSIKTA